MRCCRLSSSPNIRAFATPDLAQPIWPRFRDNNGRAIKIFSQDSHFIYTEGSARLARFRVAQIPKHSESMMPVRLHSRCTSWTIWLRAFVVAGTLICNSTINAQVIDAQVMNGVGFELATTSDPHLLDESLLNILQVGGNAVALDLNWTQTSTSVSSPELSNASAMFATLGPVVDAIHARGLSVFLRTRIVLPQQMRTAGVTPDSPGEWFDNYGLLLNQTADFANEKGIGLMSIGAGLNSLESPIHTDNWTRIIEDVRSRYDGPLTYAAEFEFDRDFGGGFEELPWWSSLDIVGINARVPLTSDFNATADELSESAAFLVDDIESWWRRDGNEMPVVLSNVGFPSIDGGATATDTFMQNNIDLEEQALAYDALTNAFQDREWIQGVFWDGWSSDAHAGGAGDAGLTPQHKPAERVLAAHFGGEPTFVVRPPLLGSWETGFGAWRFPDSTPDDTGELGLSTLGATEGATSITLPSSGFRDLHASTIWTLEGSEAYSLFQLAFANVDQYEITFDVSFDRAETNGEDSQMVVTLADDADFPTEVEVLVELEEGEGLQTTRVQVPLSSFGELNPASLFYELQLGTDNDWTGTVYIDNLRLSSTIAGDVTNDAVLDHNDIDALSDAVRHGDYEELYDLNQDGLVDDFDRIVWTSEAGTFPGDFDLNGRVEFVDFLTLSDHFGLPGNWRQGDADGDRTIDFPDFLSLSRNFGGDAGIDPATATSVPEPGLAAGWLVFVAMLLRSWRFTLQRVPGNGLPN